VASVLSTVRDIVAFQLQAQPWVSDYGLSVFTLRKGVTADAIRLACEGLDRPAIYVFLPEPKENLPNLPATSWHQTEIEVQVFEYRDLNKSDIEAEEIAELILASLHHFAPRQADQVRIITAHPTEAWTVLEDVTPFAINLKFHCYVSLAESIRY